VQVVISVATLSKSVIHLYTFAETIMVGLMWKTRNREWSLRSGVQSTWLKLDVLEFECSTSQGSPKPFKIFSMEFFFLKSIYVHLRYKTLCRTLLV
jgi:hypothetical protein